MPATPSIPLRIFKNSWLSDSGSITTSPCGLSTGRPQSCPLFFPKVCNSSLTNLQGYGKREWLLETLSDFGSHLEVLMELEPWEYLAFRLLGNRPGFRCFAL